MRKQRAGLVGHELAIAGDIEDSDEQERGKDPVDHRCPKEGLYRIDVEKIHGNPDERRKYQDGVEGPGALEGFVQSFLPLERFRKSVGGRSGEGWNGQEADPDESRRIKKVSERAGQGSECFGRLFLCVDLGDSVGMERHGGRQNDEIHHEIGEERARANVEFSIDNLA